eukprot:CAMPEP_0203683412 /NCGR_PEP_ID=MMETSP0090-20130426/47506_1 /ASSEMBLY_ACC=CAM_ASM_001088 /TAXON_ID=426623 /ORGANISM="Chaetoceros affinis, Strain CCMP159" /LENGTH=353 /DNA_ID=CAMNT_0050552555 /DNA_START=32 /DNA_END=1093 /DNA_ORIENTATION=-
MIIINQPTETETGTGTETETGMNDIPDVTLKIILTYLPPQSFLPICHVSHRFHRVWIELKRHQEREHEREHEQHQNTKTNVNNSDCNSYKYEYKYKYKYNETNPLALGNLFETSWHGYGGNNNDDSSTKSNNNTRNHNHNHNHNSSQRRRNILNTKLLAYYIRNGFGSINVGVQVPNNDNSNSSNNNNNNINNNTNDNDSGSGSGSGNNNNNNNNNNSCQGGSKILRKVMLETASRGDIEGMWFMSKNNYFPLNDKEICCTAGAAGQLEALQWLRGEVLEGVQCGLELEHDLGRCTNNSNITTARRKVVCCPWDPTEVHREAAENSHDHILEYVEKNCEGHEIQMSYGVGLPW